MFVRYACAKSEQAQKEKAYKVYVTDALKAIVGASSRYLDWIDCKPQDNRTGAEIAADIIKKVGLKVKAGGGELGCI